MVLLANSYYTLVDAIFPMVSLFFWYQILIGAIRLVVSSLLWCQPVTCTKAEPGSWHPLEIPPATGQLLAWIHQILGMGPVDQQ